MTRTGHTKHHRSKTEGQSMELKRRKRTKHSGPSSKRIKRIKQNDGQAAVPMLSDSSSNTVTKSKRQRKIPDQNTPNSNPPPDTEIAPDISCIQLKRPVYKPSKEDIEGKHQLEPTIQFEIYLRSLGKLHQDLATNYKLHYHRAHLLTKQARIDRLRRAEDLNTIKNILANLKELIKYKQLVEAEERKDAAKSAFQLLNESKNNRIDTRLHAKLLALNNFTNAPDSDLIAKVAEIHSIDITDLRDIRTLWDGFPKGRGALDPNFVSAHEIAAISKNFDKQLAKERDGSLAWPTLAKTKRGKKNGTKAATSENTGVSSIDIGKDIPLYNSV